MTPRGQVPGIYTMNSKHVFTSLLMLPLALIAFSACDDGDDGTYEDEILAAEELDYAAEKLQQMIEDGTADSFPHPDEVNLQLDTGESNHDALFTIEEVRLRHASTGKCLYGTGVEDSAVHNWGCWNDPGMTYKIYTHILSGTKLLLHANTGKYIESHPSDGAVVTNRSGYNPYMPLRFVFDDAGGGKVRIRNYSNGKCLYGTNTDGGTVHNWVCWADPNMEFYIDPV